MSTTLQIAGLLGFGLLALILYVVYRYAQSASESGAAGRRATSVSGGRTKKGPAARPRDGAPAGSKSATPAQSKGGATARSKGGAPARSKGGTTVRSKGAESARPAGATPARAAAKASPPRAAIPLPKIAALTVKKRVDWEAIPYLPAGLQVPEPAEGSANTLAGALEEASGVIETLTARKGIIESFHGGESDPRKLSDLVLRDPVLAAHVLKAVNSPYYSLPNPVGSVFRAILLMGHVEVRNLIWKVCLADATGSLDDDTQARMSMFWAHSFNVSRTAYAVAKSFSLPNPDEISTAALLHDVGKLLALSAWPDKGKALYPDVRFSDHGVLEREIDGFDLGHAQIGAQLIASWSLPQAICDAIRYHHHPSYLPPSEVEGDAVTIAVVHAADLLCHIHRYEASPEKLSVYKPRDGWLQKLGVRNSLAKLLDEWVVLALDHQAREKGERPKGASGQKAEGERRAA